MLNRMKLQRRFVQGRILLSHSELEERKNPLHTFKADLRESTAMDLRTTWTGLESVRPLGLYGESRIGRKLRSF